MIDLVEISEIHRDSLVQMLNNENVNRGLLQVPFPYSHQDADIFIKKCFNNKTDKNDFAFAIENDGVHVHCF